MSLSPHTFTARTAILFDRLNFYYPSRPAAIERQAILDEVVRAYCFTKDDAFGEPCGTKAGELLHGHKKHHCLPRLFVAHVRARFAVAQWWAPK